jgi:hypothetical protein
VETGGSGFSLGTVNVTVPQTVPETEHSAIRQMGGAGAYTCKGYLEHPTQPGQTTDPVNIMIDSGNTTAATAAISMTCTNRIGLKWGATAPRMISTASKEEACMIVRGEITNLCLKLEGGKEPLVLKNA